MRDILPKGSKKRSAKESADATGGAQQPEYIVGVGASAGGLEALQKFFASMPEDSGLAFVVIQHLSPHFKSMMDELLARHTTLPVEVVTEPVEIHANTVYLLPPRREMVLDGYRLSVRSKPIDPPQQPISTFFSSLAEQHADRAVAVVLSGSGSDGSTGVVDVREAGGLVFVQSQESAKFDGMPHSAVSTGVAHGVYPVERIPWAILQTIEHGFPQEEPQGDELTGGYPALDQIIEQLNRVYDLDFKLYKSGTIHRRIERRMALAQINSAQAYADFLSSNPEELESLYKDMLIGVTQFFRNPAAFEAFNETVIPSIVNDPKARPEVRVWVPGCASGEEAYSVAMLLLEALEGHAPPRKIRVFATDRHRGSLQKAADGIYTEQELEAVPASLRAKYFVPEDEGRLRVSPLLRRCLIFSTHNVIKDPPFTQLDLVSCRNLLIYFQPIAQNRVLSSFYCGLRHQGHLFLGHSESCGNLGREFEPVDARWKIYRKVTSHHLPLLSSESVSLEPSHRLEPHLFHAHRMRKESGKSTRIYEAIMGRFVPSGVLVNAQREVLHLFGSASEFLRPRPGPITTDVVDLAQGNLRIALASALQGAMRGKEKVALRSVRLEPESEASSPDEYRQIDVEVEVFADRVADEQYYLISLVNLQTSQRTQIESAPVPAGPDNQFDSSIEAKNRIRDLEHELSQTRESLQTVVEELETSNEELQSSNEELLSSNEELQSTNEELHSVNEELYTVNAEYEQKINDLNQATSDLRNFMESVEVGSVFTDRELNIRLFTPAATDVLNLIPQDVGRDLRHITSKVRGDLFLDELGSVLETGKAHESEIELPDGRVMLRRIRSYFDHQREPAGLILTFVEVTRVRLAEQRRKVAQSRLRQALSAAKIGFWEQDLRGGRLLWDLGVVELLGLNPQGLARVDFEGDAYVQGSVEGLVKLVCPENRAQVAALLGPEISSSRLEPIQFEIETPGGERRNLCLSWSELGIVGQGAPEWRSGTLSLA